MPDASEIRARFRQFVGDEDYYKFVCGIPESIDDHRLLFWQERAWERFVAANSDCELILRDMVNVFANCPEFGVAVRREAWCALVQSWLGARTFTVEELEGEGIPVFPNSEQRLLMSSRRKGWLKLRSTMRDGDILQEFRSPLDTWQWMSGRAGVALVRDGNVIDAIVTLMN